jgi:hypothetical protein
MLVVAGTMVYMLYSGRLSKIVEIRITAAKFDLLRPTADFLFLVKQTKLIEKGLYDRLPEAERYSKKKRMNAQQFEQYVALLYFYRYYHNIDIDEIRATTSSESLWNPRAYSKSGAKGLNQLMPDTFNSVNRKILCKYGKFDIMEIYHNTEACIAAWIDLRNWLEWKLDRKPLLQEVAWAYNASPQTALRAIRSGNHEEILSQETIYHGKKVLFYYRSYKVHKYDVYWVEDVLRKKK